jgi:hypothetical protein
VPTITGWVEQHIHKHRRFENEKEINPIIQKRNEHAQELPVYKDNDSVELVPTEAVGYGDRWLKKRYWLLLLYEVRWHVVALVRMLRHVEVRD